MQSVVRRDKILNGFKALFCDSVAGDTFDSVQLFFSYSKSHRSNKFGG